MRWPFSSRAETRAQMTSKNITLADFGLDQPNPANIHVSPENAENLSAYFACVQTISESMACLPISLYARQADNGRAAAPDHPLSRLLSRQPNPLQTTPEFIELMTAHCLAYGNAYAQITRDTAGRITALKPIHPYRVGVSIAPSGRLRYDISNPSGATTLLQEEVLHLKDRSDDGIIGRSRLSRARDTVATSFAIQTHTAASFGNGLHIGGILKATTALPEVALNRLKAALDRYRGSRNAKEYLILENGIDYSATGISPEDAELLDSRRFSVEEIARLFRIPPPIIGDLTHGTYSNVTELGRWFMTYSLQPWVNKWEAALEAALLTETEAQTYFIEFKTENFLRGDIQTRYAAYAQGLQNGFLNIDEVRAMENRNALPNGTGQTFRAQVNLAAVDAPAPDREPTL